MAGEVRGLHASRDGQADVLNHSKNQQRVSAESWSEMQRKPSSSTQRGSRAGQQADLNHNHGTALGNDNTKSKQARENREHLTFSDPFERGTRADINAHKLWALAHERIEDPVVHAQFGRDLRRFEQRAAGDRLGQHEVNETYRQIQRLLDSRGDGYTKEWTRPHLAQQILHHAAEPETIGQGNHNTCTLAALQARMFTKDPSDAARFIADVALTGQFKIQDGSVIKINAINTRPDLDAHYSPHPTMRSYASQIFQTAAANVFWQRTPVGIDTDQKCVRGKPGDWRYVQIASGTSESVDEHLQIKKNGRWETVFKDPGMLEPTIPLLIYEQIAGSSKGQKVSYFVGKGLYKEGPGVESPANASQFERKLMELKQYNQFPALVTVFPGNALIPKLFPTAHTISIRGIDAAGNVTLSDSSNVIERRKVSAKLLFDAMYPSKRWLRWIESNQGHHE